MKKMISVLLTAMLLVSTCAALGEEIKLNENADSFDVSLALPEGATLVQEAGVLGVNGAITIPAIPDLKCLFSLGPDDQYADMNLAHLSDEDLAHIFAEICIDMGEASYEVVTTSTGVAIMTILKAGQAEMLNLALVDGYFLYVDVYHENNAALTEDELTLVKQLLDSVKLTEQ